MTQPARTIDLNADLGEGFPNDEALLQRVTSASICCGAHAGDVVTIARTLALARRFGVVVGAHPGFADREHFGRREQRISAADVTALILEQASILSGIAHAEGLAVRFIKPHGALYNQAQADPQVAAGVAAAVERLGLPVLGQPGSQLARLAIERGVTIITEGFPERRYTADGRLVSRSEPDAVIHAPTEISAQALRLVAQGLRTLCIHGDDSAAVEKADLVAQALRTAGVELRGFVASSAG